MQDIPILESFGCHAEVSLSNRHSEYPRPTVPILVRNDNLPAVEFIICGYLDPHHQANFCRHPHP